MKFLTLLILCPCLLFAQLMPKYFSNTHNFTSVSSTINNKFNETSTDKAIDDFQKTDIDKIDASQATSDSISKTKYEKKAYVDSSKIIYSWGEGPPFIMRYCMGINNFKKEHYSMGSGEILNILEKDIKKRNMPNKFYNTAKLHYRIETTILFTSITSIVAGIIMGKNGYKPGYYISLGGLITLPLNSFVYSLIWQWMYLDDAINEYNKNLAY
ncbi:MAG: hypothetical protein II835_05900 [Fibrobacter sp.]|nr:hypothetical protein [Fibrobacter sp.]